MWQCPNCDKMENDKFDFCQTCGTRKDSPSLKSANSNEFSVADQVNDEDETDDLYLLPDEKVIKANFPGLLLTTHRISYHSSAKAGGELSVLTFNDRFTSLMLDELVSCDLIRDSKTIFLLLAITSFLLSVAITVIMGIDNLISIGTAFAILFVIAYFFTRRQVLELASAGATIRINAANFESQELYDLIDIIETAKNARYLLGQRSP